jgi:phosphomannomutase
MSDGHRFDSSILREYDIRGVVGTTLEEADALALGKTLGSHVANLGGTTVCVGYDGRLTSPSLEAALVTGFESTGLHVVRIGCGPTPMLYFASHVLNLDAAVMVTGSHNPPSYNGFKMVVKNAPFWGPEIQKLGADAALGEWVTGTGGSASVDVADWYVARVAADYRSDHGLKVAWDSGNGSAGAVLSKLTSKLPGTHILLNEEIDGTFPAHHPDPTIPENLEQLRQTVAADNCDIGIAFDGDGDRIGVVDSLGRIVWGDQLLALLAGDVLCRHPGAAILADVKASQVLFDEISRLGGKPVMGASGHSIIRSKMVEIGAPLAGEMSGHIFFKDRYYGFDDALFAAVRLIDLIATAGRSASSMLDDLPVMCNTPEVRFEVAEERKFAVVAEVKARLVASGATVNDVDGVRVSVDGGWWLLRASNTQNSLVCRCEASNEDALSTLKGSVNAQLRLSGIDANPF